MPETISDLLSPPPRLEGDDTADHARTIVHWFDRNFAAVETFPRPIQLAAANRQLVLHLAEVRAVFRRAFPDAVASAIETAFTQLEQRGSVAWLPPGIGIGDRRPRASPPSGSPAAPAPASGKPVSLSLLALLSAALVITLIWALG